ncbi:MAG: hypothetical protein OQL06_03115 [Gammaproteobacteria bacterium]|nr:hypothetical protein [Gammaproteobacteria bacterium]
MYMSQSQLAEQQGAYDQMSSTIFGAAGFGFMPAFMDLHNKETHLAAYEDGMPSVVHILDGLPDYWISERDELGKAVSLKSGVIAGFMRNGCFYTLNEIINDLRDA